jgi:hypothetical protein
VINSIYIDVEELVLELDRAAESPKVAQDWAARFRDTLIYGGRKKNPLPFGMYCITLSKGFAANGKLGRWKSIAKGILNKRDNNENPTEEEIVAEIIAQNGREEYEKVLADIKAAKNAKNLSADGDTSDGSPNIYDGSDAASLETRTSADTKTLDGLTDKDERPVDGRATSKPSRTTPPQNSYGEFGNVKMTTAEFEKFVQAVGAERANALIEELSSYLASSGKRYKSHYATLLNWGRRKDKEETPKQKFLTTEEISRRNYEESKKQLAQILEARKHG